jgi:hypothetical protein
VKHSIKRSNKNPFKQQQPKNKHEAGKFFFLVVGGGGPIKGRTFGVTVLRDGVKFHHQFAHLSFFFFPLFISEFLLFRACFLSFFTSVLISSHL